MCALSGKGVLCLYPLESNLDLHLSERAAGILMHISSLPGSPQNGDLGRAAYEFVDFLAASKQRWWQTLPVNPYGLGYSPYSTSCSLAGEPLYIALDLLAKDGLLGKKFFAPQKFESTSRKVDYDKAQKWRRKHLREAFAQFQTVKMQTRFASELASFRRAQKYWLDDFCLYTALSQKFGHDWSQWPDALRCRQAEALAGARKEFAAEVAFAEFCQFFFFRQWQQLKAYAKKKGVGLIGDIPIFVAHASVDVWAHQKYFLLDKNGKCEFVAGVPPDRFNPDGQLWGNALYNWPVLAKDKFAWWIKRFQVLQSQFDVIRLDHFIGFHRYWRIPAKAKTAKTGKWCESPGKKLFNEVYRQLPNSQFIAEDLGLVTPEVWQLRDDFEMPGMRVLQFGFAQKENIQYHMPYHCPKNGVYYSGTHDNHTLLGWYKWQKAEQKKATAETWPELKTLVGQTPTAALETMIRMTLLSPANLAILPMQDYLALDNRARMNIPGVPDGNWTWRATSAQLREVNVKESIGNLATATGRVVKGKKA